MNTNRPIPERVPCLALNPPYAGLLFGENGKPGRKSLESRTWEWPYSPGWCAIYATKAVDREAVTRLGLIATPHTQPIGCIIGIVWFDVSRPMTADDTDGACYPFWQDRFVWPILESRRFAVPDRDHLKRGPQKFVYVPRAVIMAGLQGIDS